MKYALLTAACAVLGATSANATPSPLTPKEIQERHGRTPEEVRKFVASFFERLRKEGYEVTYSVDPNRSRASFSAKYYRWYIGTVRIQGTIVWDRTHLRVTVTSDRYQKRVEDKITAFLKGTL